MLRQALRIASRQASVARAPAPTQRLAIRQFGAVTKHTGPENAVARPFPGASRTEPEMEYIEEPSMLYMTFLFAVPIGFEMWFLTKFV
mmetsp:Transcript_55759/g.120500  ORF Transcript_55759/g.120500 Transcript_55759/m.120500 type:complete len:88 (-) Transcript_55759:148-411(-)